MMHSVFPLAGIGTYIPSEGEHLVLSLQKSDNNIMSCSELNKPTTQGRLHIVHTHIDDKYTQSILLLDQTQRHIVRILGVVTCAYTGELLHNLNMYIVLMPTCAD